MRYLAAFTLSLILLPLTPARTPDRTGLIHATPISLDRDHPERRVLGALTYERGWVLTSEHGAFGGISSMRALGGGRLMAVSDRGTIFHFTADAANRVWRLEPQAVPDGPGPKKYFGWFDRDIESMAYDPESGRTWFAFEFWNSIWRYDPSLTRADGKRARPREMREWPLNGGTEAMTRLRDGRFLLFSEEASPDEAPAGTTEAMLFPRDPLQGKPKPIRFFYRPPEGFVPTDAAELPDGRVLMLNRHFSPLDGLAAAITLIDPSDIRRDRVLEPRIVARLSSPMEIDNMEALAVETHESRLIVWIASDNNFSLLQRTLLMQFVLDPDRLP